MVWFASLDAVRGFAGDDYQAGHFAEGAAAAVALCRALRPLRAARDGF